MAGAKVVVRWCRRVAPALIVFLLHAGCSPTRARQPPDGGAGDTLGAGTDASLPPEVPVRCGDARCDDPANGAALDEESCCLPSGGCGLRSRLLDSDCSSPHGAGDVDLTCPGNRLADGTEIQGCCTPAGRCGLNDRFGDLGCVPTANDGGATAADTCRYVPEATCRSVVEVTCDGPEDCASGQRCCGRASHGSFDAFGCFASCDVESATAAELWFEICRDSASCQNEGEVCAGASGLPSFLGRCHPNATSPEGGVALDAGASIAGQSCGAVACGTGEKCCLRDPLDPYCAPAGVPCECGTTASD